MTWVKDRSIYILNVRVPFFWPHIVVLLQLILFLSKFQYLKAPDFFGELSLITWGKVQCFFLIDHVILSCVRFLHQLFSFFHLDLLPQVRVIFLFLFVLYPLLWFPHYHCHYFFLCQMMVIKINFKTFALYLFFSKKKSKCEI